MPAGLILAAGESRRMGFPKALLAIGDETFADRLIRILGERCAPVVLVLGAEADRIRAGLARADEARIVVNTDYRLGQLSSMQCGLRAIPPVSPGALFTLVDHPGVGSGTVSRLLEESAALLAIARYGGRRGHPVWIRRELFEEFLGLPPEASAREVIARHAASAVYTDTDDPAVVEDIDDAGAYRAMQGRTRQ
jgi:molybdenum cofactor cytidylyltransferase